MAWADGTTATRDADALEAAVLAVLNRHPGHPVFAVDGVLGTGQGQARWYAPVACTIVEVRASVGTAPTGAAILVDVEKNGTTIFTTQGNRPTIAVSTHTDVSGTPDVTALAAGDYLTFSVDQVGSTIPGSDLTVQVRLYPVP